MSKSVTKRKILYVIPYFVPAWSYGGPVKVTFDFARELTETGDRVTVATTDVLDAKSRNGKSHEKIQGVEIYRFRNISNTLAKRFNLYAPVGFSRWLKKNISQYDLVHIHEFFTYQSLITGRECRKHGKPYVIQPHGSLSPVGRKTRFYHLKNFILKRFASFALYSGALIVLGENEKKDAQKTYPLIKSKIKIVPNGLDLEEFRGVKRVDLRKRYGIPKESGVVVFIGRLNYIKGLDISLKALAKIKDKAKFTFLIIGPDDGEKENLMKISAELGIADRIIFTGLMSGREKLETMKSADLSLLNSRSEGLPTTLLESAALGLPVVCSRESHLPEVDRFQAGFQVRSTEETAEKVIKILKNAGLRRIMSKNALKLADNFNLNKCARTLNEIYESIV